jgi:predicted transcriptional regulator
MMNKNNMDNSNTNQSMAVAQVVASFAQRSDVSSDDIVDLTRRLLTVFGSIQDDAGQSATAPAAIAHIEKPTAIAPAISLEKAVTDDKVYCLCCGRGFTMLKRHLKAEHGLTEDEYRQMFNLPDSMPLVAPKYSERKAAYAKEVGLGKYSREAGLEEGATVR